MVVTFCAIPASVNIECEYCAGGIGSSDGCVCVFVCGALSHYSCTLVLCNLPAYIRIDARVHDYYWEWAVYVTYCYVYEPCRHSLDCD